MIIIMPNYKASAAALTVSNIELTNLIFADVVPSLFGVYK